MPEEKIERWELWYPKAAAAGISFSRSRIRAESEVLVHAAPEYLTVEVYDEQGVLLSKGEDLKMTAETPMARLVRKGDAVERQDFWPEPSDIGCLVLLPGGEAGTLLEWWHAPDKSEWRWKIEFYNKKD
jgi:hypothetical protein